VFPEPDRLDSALTKDVVRLTVPLLVPLDFGLPKGAIDGRDVTTPRATVPETTIKKNGDPAVLEKDVGLPFDDFGVHDPTPDAGSYQQGAKPCLGRSIASTSDCGHTTRMRRRNVSKTTVG
jgi:hypothetical protein